MENRFLQIDQAILDWASRNQLVLHTHIADLAAPEFRCIYTSNQHGECCQIWIEPPTNDCVLIHAEDVESRFDEAMRYDWKSTIQDLPEVLDVALGQVRDWLNRGDKQSRV